MFSDARSIGIALYPYYPVSGRFLHLGNPFKKVGIEIIYKKEAASDKKFRWEAFQKAGWTIYSIESVDTLLPINDLYSRVKTKYGNEGHFEDLSDEEDYNNFINDHKETNGECLLYYIREKHFSSEYVSDENDY